MDTNYILSDCVALVQDFFSVDNFVETREDILSAVAKIKCDYRLSNEYDEPLEHEIGYFCGMPEYC